MHRTSSKYLKIIKYLDQQESKVIHFNQSLSEMKKNHF